MLFVKSVPLYKKVSKNIIEMIHNGDIKENILPSEDTLSKMFGVSRSTIREALSELDSHGIITKKQGVGNIVMTSALSTKFRIDLKLDFAEMLEECGHKAKYVQSLSRYENLTIDQIHADFFVYDELLYADDEIAAIFKVRILKSFFTTTPAEDLEKADFFSFIFQYTNEVIEHSIVYFEAAIADKKTAERFKLSIGDPILSWKEVFYTSRDECICTNKIYFNPRVLNPTILRSGFDPQERKAPLKSEIVHDFEAL